MFSWASSRKSSGVILTVQRLGSRTLFYKSQPSISSSPPSSSISSCNNEHGYGDRSSSGSRSSTFDLILRSVSSGALILGGSIGYSYWNQNSSVAFADSTEEARWTLSDDPDRFKITLFPDPYRRRKFFVYEKRKREHSPPEKVFEYFASVRSPSGEAFMTPQDLMRAVVPVFPPYDSPRVREGSLRGEPEQVPVELQCAPSKFFMLFDTDGDGLISFQEYIFFVTLLSIPESSFTVAFKMFDLDNSGDIDREEFNRVMALMRNQSKQTTDAHRVKVCVDKGGLLEYFFGKEGKKGLKHERFVQFFRDLHDEILRLEYAHYDYKSQGSISAKDFALSLIASADIRDINKLLDRVDEMCNEPHLDSIQITFKEFKDFAQLRQHLQSFSLAIFSYGEVNGVLTKSDLQRAAAKVCGISLTNNVIDIIYHVFDADGDGHLSANEFVRALQNRGGETTETGIAGLLTCWLNCATKAGCSFF